MTGRKRADSGAVAAGRRPAQEGAAAPLAAGRKRAVKVGAEARRAKGVSMLMAGAKQADIAAACGVSQRQVERWAAAARGQVQAARAEAEATAAGVLIAASRKAAETLVQVLDDPEASASDRTRAALAVLDRTGHGPTEKRELSGKDGAALVLTVAQADALATDGRLPEERGDGET